MNKKEVPEITDTDGKDDFTEGKSTFDKEIIKEVDLTDEQIAAYEKIFEKDTTFWQRLGRFIKAENKAGRQAKIVKDFALTFVPWGRTISNTTEMATEIISDNDMDDKSKFEKVRNWISWNDKDGNFSLKELGKSLLKIAVPAGIVYVLTYYGLWDSVSQIMELF